jgi:hypothetical protein
LLAGLVGSEEVVAHLVAYTTAVFIRRENPGHRLASRHLSQAILKELGKDVQIQFS